MKDKPMKLFGLEFRATEVEAKELPLYLSAGRTFMKLSGIGVEFLLVRIPADGKTGIVALEKQAALLAEKYGMPAAFGFETISRARRDSLIERNIPFIVDSEQLYLPFLGAALSERFARPKRVNAGKMMPVTQALFLYMLYHCNGKPIMKKDAAEAIGVTRTSLTRASDQLLAMKLITQENRGKESYMILQGSGPELIEKARPFLINPVQKTVTVRNSGEYGKLPLSGESALAKKTMLNEVSVPVRAAWKGDIHSEDLAEVDIRWEPNANAVELQLWKYDPARFMKDGLADPVSLAMSFEGNADERIEGAIEEYMEDYSW